MKVVLIEPRAALANVYSQIPMPLLGPLYLGTILKNRGHDVVIYKEDVYTPDYSKINADVIGISILTSTAKRGYEIAKKFPREKVIIGGVHASLMPYEALQYARQVVIGEAEEVICDMVEGKIKDSLVQGKAVENLDSLPIPDYSLVQGMKSLRIRPISTSRGCPHGCSFCSVTKMFGHKYRFRGAESVLTELDVAKKQDIFFCDDNFVANPQRTRDLLARIIPKKIKGWTCQVRCEVARDPELLDLMHKAGCRVVCIGFESINQKTLQAFNKKQTVTQIIDSIRNFHRKNIKIHGMFVLGGEDDTAMTVWDTVRFALKEKIDTIQMMILTPFPGTKTHDFLAGENRIFTKDWSLYDGQHIVFRPNLVSPKDLQLNVVRAYCKFYSIYNSLVLFTQLSFRNAFFRLMGHCIVKAWKNHNRDLYWIRNTARESVKQG